MNIDEGLLVQSQQILGTHGTTDTVHRALEAVISRHGRQWLIENPVEMTPEQFDAMRDYVARPESGQQLRVAETPIR